MQVELSKLQPYKINSNFTLYKYELPLTKLYRWSKGAQSTRSGFIVTCCLDNNFFGYGEIAWPPQENPDSAEFITNADSILSNFNIQKDDLSISIDEHFSNISPRLRCGLVSAWLWANATKENLPLNAFLAKRFNRQALDQVPVNILITEEQTEQAAQIAEHAYLKQGVKTFKIKLVGDTNSDFARVSAIRQLLPNANIRLDPNGVWSILQAYCELDRYADLNIEYVEDPVSINVASAELRQLIYKSPIPIAIDEAATNLIAIRQLVQEIDCKYVILKPQRLGGPDLLLETVKFLEKNNIQHTLTGSLETAVGLTVGLHCASLLKPPIAACGLGTSSYFANDLGNFPKPVNGCLQL